MITNKKMIEKLIKNKDITKLRKKDTKDAVEFFRKILHHIRFEDAIALEYGASNWAAIEGYMLKNIHKKVPSFGNKNILSKKALEIYKEH
jgi:hypothetical protein